MRNPILFGDYRTALEDSEPRLYEDIQDYEACKALFQEVMILNIDGPSTSRDTFDWFVNMLLCIIQVFITLNQWLSI